MSSSDFCGCDSSFLFAEQMNMRTVHDIVATPGVAEKLTFLKSDAERQARDWARHGFAAEALEWTEVATILGRLR